VVTLEGGDEASLVGRRRRVWLAAASRVPERLLEVSESLGGCPGRPARARRTKLSGIDGAIVRGEEIHQTLVVRLLHAEQRQKSSIASSGRGEPPSNQLPKVRARHVASGEQPVDVFPEPHPTGGQPIIEVTDNGPSPLEDHIAVAEASREHGWRKVARLDGPAADHGRELLDDILQFTDVAGPSMPFEQTHGFFAENQ